MTKEVNNLSNSGAARANVSVPLSNTVTFLLEELGKSKALAKTNAAATTTSSSSADSIESWVSRQQLQDLYCQLLTADLELALDRKLEQELWNEGFRQPITEYQSALCDKRHPRRPEVHTRLTLLLEQATGFYISLLHRLCSQFSVELPCRRRLPPGVLFESGNASSSDVIKSTATGYPKRGSIIYLCQHCLVHLGDVARYQQNLEQARTYYQWASAVGPSSGHPYNQLAILEIALGHRLTTLFYYVRAVACKTPFPAAATNLEKLLTKAAKESLPPSDVIRLNQFDLLSVYLQLEALLYLQMDLTRAKRTMDRFLGSLHDQLAVNAFTWDELIMMTAVHVYVHERAMLQCATTDYLHLMLSSLLGLVDVLAQACFSRDNNTKDAAALPALAVAMQWLETRVANLPAAGQPPLTHLALLLNKLVKISGATHIEFEFDRGLKLLPPRNSLPEEELLSGFLPIFSTTSSTSSSAVPLSATGDNDAICKQRILQLVACSRRFVAALPSPASLQCFVDDLFVPVFTAPVAPSQSRQTIISTSSSPAKPVRNVAMQSILAQAAAQASSVGSRQLPSNASTTTVTAALKVQSGERIAQTFAAGNTRQPGLIVSAEIAKSIQEHAAAAAAKETALLASGSINLSQGGAAGGIELSNGSMANRNSVLQDSDANINTAGSISAAERRQLYNQNREAFQKDLPPRFARRVTQPQHLDAVTASRSTTASLATSTPTLSLAGKESEPLFSPTSTMWFPPPPTVSVAQRTLLMSSQLPQFYTLAEPIDKKRQGTGAAIVGKTSSNTSTSELVNINLYGSHGTVSHLGNNVWPPSPLPPSLSLAEMMGWSDSSSCPNTASLSTDSVLHPTQSINLQAPSFVRGESGPMLFDVDQSNSTSMLGFTMNRTEQLNKAHVDYVQSLWSTPVDLLVRQTHSSRQFQQQQQQQQQYPGENILK